jgi:hypothetical protein
MKRINFKKVKVEIEIGHFQPQDFSRVIGNALFSLARNIEMDELARKIHASQEAIDIPDEQFAEMMSTLDGQLFYRVKKAIEANAENVKQPSNE